MPVAMAYVPWQKWQDLYDPCKGLERGTIFKELDKTLPRKRRYSPMNNQMNSQMNRQMMNRRQLLNHINEVSFAVDEVKLYLDTHPCDTEALEYFREMSNHRNQL